MKKATKDNLDYGAATKRRRRIESPEYCKTKYGSCSKNLNKLFNRIDVPWVQVVWEKLYKNGKLPNHIKKGSFWRDALKLLQEFNKMATL